MRSRQDKDVHYHYLSIFYQRSEPYGKGENIKIGKEKKNMICLYLNDMIVYTENTEESINRLF